MTPLKNGPTPYSLTLPSAVVTLPSFGTKGSAISYGKQQQTKHAQESSRVKSTSARLTLIQVSVQAMFITWERDSADVILKVHTYTRKTAIIT